VYQKRVCIKRLLESRLRRYSTTVLQKPIDKPFVELPSVYQIKLFIRFLAQSRTGLIKDNITTATVQNRLSSLKRAIKLHTHYQYNETQNTKINQFIENELVLSGKLSSAAYKKPIAPLLVAEDLVHFSWACDEYYMHSRTRLQVSFSIILMTLLGSRPGEFIESKAWKHSNEGLVYNDIILNRPQTETYCGYLLDVRLRNRKGHWDNQKHSYACPAIRLT
jgi:hypothetical protein